MLKKLMLLILLIGFGYKASAQSILNKLIINDVRYNKMDVTKQFVDDDAYIVFYTLPNKNTMYMANYRSKSGSQSFGAMYDLSSQEIAATDTSYKTETYDFRWSYTNSYDGKTGTASIHLLYIYKPLGTAFIYTMITESLDVSVYKGFVDGSLHELR